MDRLSYIGQSQPLVKYQKIDDIIDAVKKFHGHHCKEYDIICNDFWCDSVPDTCDILFCFCKKNVTYDIEPDENQTVKSPGAILYHGKGDCKHYASFIAGVLDALCRRGHRINWCYRFAGYYPNNRSLHHVFVIVRYAGREIWIDPVLKTFDNKKKYYYYCDVKPDSMLSYVCGVDDGIGRHKRNIVDEFGDSAFNPLHPGVVTPGATKKLMSIFHHGHKHSSLNVLPSFAPVPMKVDGVSGKHKKSPHPKKGFHIKLPKIKVGNVILKVANAPSRNAFLLLLKIDTFSMAKAIWTKAYYPATHGGNPDKWNKLVKMWKKAGGDEQHLLASLKEGVRWYNHLHKTSQQVKMAGIPYDEDYDEGVGVVQFAVPAAIAAATPILVAIKDLLKQMGVNTSAKPGSGGVDDQIGDAVKKTHKKVKDAAGDQGAVTADGAGVDSQGAAAGTDANGTDHLAINDVNSDNEPDIATQTKNAITNPTGGGDSGSADSNSSDPGSADSDSSDPGGGNTQVAVIPPTKENFLHKIEDEVKGVWENHKTLIIIGGAAVVALPIIMRAVSNHKPKRRRK